MSQLRQQADPTTQTFFPAVMNTALPPPIAAAHKEAARFLAQATLGATDELIDTVVQLGYRAWLDQQRDQPISRTRPYLDELRTDLLQNDPPAAQVPYQRVENPTRVPATNFTTVWMRNLIFGPDQLRQRVAWGGNHLVLGGPVLGQRLYGIYPEDLRLGSGLDVGGKGRLAPTTAVDQYMAELALWFGLARSDLSTVFPNITNFYNPASASLPIGFLPV